MRPAPALPFGLMLDAGAALQIDDAVRPGTLRFSTCLPVGCLVPLDLDAEMIAALREGTVLKVTVQSVDANEATLSVSLKGLGQQSTDSMC
jgi:invasion protein IalB